MKKKDFLIAGLKIFITILLFWYINKTIDFSQILQIQCLFLIFFIALGLGFAQQFLLFLRWRFSLNAAGVQVSEKSVLKSYFIGQFLGTVSPARSGDLAKIFYLENTPKKRGLLAILIDSAIALATLFITGLWNNQDCKYFNALSVLAAADMFLILVALARCLHKGRALDFGRLFIVSFTQNVAIILQGALIFSMSLDISLWEASFAVAAAYCIMPLVPISIAKIGVREFSFSFFLSIFVFDPNLKSIVFTASYILLLCNSVIFMIPGIFLFYGGKGEGNPAPNPIS
jgi:hypothetical protein